MGYSQNDSHAYYHDDPIEERSGRKLQAKFLTTAVVVFASVFFFQSTLAGNISLNSSQSIEFGQGIFKTVACSGDASVTLTPYSSFTNSTDSSVFYLDRVMVSNIPTSCRGADFTIRAYGDSDSTPLSLFNANSKTATIETIDTPGTDNDGGIAWAGAAGISVSASATGDAFTVTFTTPVAQSSGVAKITLESSKPYYVGGPGGGGGTVFYVSTTGFNCGPTFTARCKYLEAAPSGWNGGSEPTRTWAQSTPVNYQNTTVSNLSSPETATASAIGWGYRNTRAIILQGNTNTTNSAAALADSHTVTVRGVAVDDWYLASKDELNQMCKWASGLPWTSDATVCTGGTSNSGPGAADFEDNHYWSSSESGASNAWIQLFGVGDGRQFSSTKNTTYYTVRPVRAF